MINSYSKQLVKQGTVALVLLSAGLAAAPSVHAQGISVNFGSNQANLPATTAAGVVPLTNFNNVSGGNGTSVALVNSTGAASGATLTFSGGGTYHSEADPTKGGNYILEYGYLDDPNGPNPNPVLTTSATFSNLSANGFYNVYVYTSTTTAGAERDANYTLSGATTGNQTLLNKNPQGATFNGTFIAGQNYLLFSGVSGSSFTLTGNPVSATDGLLRADIDGIQIVPVAAPEASPMLVFGLGMLGLSGLALRGRKRRLEA